MVQWIVGFSTCDCILKLHGIINDTIGWMQVAILLIIDLLVHNRGTMIWKV